MATHARGAQMPLYAALAVIPSLPRPLLARLVMRAIERLDEMDGDPDLEDDGDSEDGTKAEDDFAFHYGDGPGCPISDAGEQDHTDERETWSHPDDHPSQLFVGRRP